MWPNPHFPADLVTFTEEILNEKLNFLSQICSIDSPCSESAKSFQSELNKITSKASKCCNFNPNFNSGGEKGPVVLQFHSRFIVEISRKPVPCWMFSFCTISVNLYWVFWWKIVPSKLIKDFLPELLSRLDFHLFAMSF